MSSLVRVNILVEGQTEETFVRNVLAEPLGRQGIFVTARCIETGRKHRRLYRGGMTTYVKARRDLQRWLSSDSAAYLTTMFDLYKLPGDFPGVTEAAVLCDPYAKVQQLETALSANVQNPRFIPYLQLHEFEGLLFSDVQVIDEILQVYHHSQLAALQEVRAQFTTPEVIDDGEATAPSKRLKRLYPGYDKVTFGLRIAQRIGLHTLRRECPHFAAWLTRLEGLPTPSEVARSETGHS